MSVASQTTTMPPPRRWFRRNWKWFVPSLFVAVVAATAISVFGYVQIRAYRYHQNPVYQTAMRGVQANQQLQDRLGEPIVDSDWNPQGAIETWNDATMGEAKFNFSISGPDGYADVATAGRMVDGEWFVTGLEVLFPEGDRIRLTEEIAAKQKADTPAFDPASQPKKQAKKDDAEVPPDVSVQVPEVPPGLK